MTASRWRTIAGSSPKTSTGVSFALTFEISLAVTVIALLLGYPVAYLATRVAERVELLILSLVVLPFWTSVLVRAYAWLALLQRPA